MELQNSKLGGGANRSLNTLKGFTLVELLAVIVLLGVLAIIAIPNFSKIIRNSRDDLYSKQIEVIKVGAKLWATSLENKIYLEKNTEWPYIITLGDLQDSEFLSANIKNPKTDENFPDNTLIYINKSNGHYTFQVDENTIDSNALTIQLNGDRNYKVEVNTPFTEPGFSSKDQNEVDITSSVTKIIYKNGLPIDGDIDTSILANYTIKYSVTSGNLSGLAIRRVNVVDTTAPVLTCSTCSDDLVEIESVEHYALPTVTATDNYDTNILVMKIGSFSSIIPGERKVIYSATDSSGNTSTLTMNFLVKDTIVPIIVSVNREALGEDDFTLFVEATDRGSGIKEYSFDGGKTWQTSNQYITKITNGIIPIAVKDRAGNITTFSYLNYLDNQYKEEILSGNDPVLDSGMTPIYYENDIAKIADIRDEWYNYGNKIWANAVILKENPSKDYSEKGTVVDESDVLAYFVWIPRYEYTIKGSFGVGGTSNSALGYINIKFSKIDEKSGGTATYTGDTPSNYLTHPAFTFGSKELRGIWVGKFETTGTASNPTIKPGIIALVNQNVSTQFETSLKLKSYGLENESRMMKNDEWGAVAYLSQSIYGRCPSTGTCPEIRRNNNSSFLTGYAEVNRATTGYSETSVSTNQFGTAATITKAYNNEIGKEASTTMNITGIYDMNGGAWEYVMGALADSNGKPYSGRHNVRNSGYNGKFGRPDLAAGVTNGNTSILELTTGKNWPESKYYNLYTSSDYNTACNGGKCYGQANSETVAWYGDDASMPNSSTPWVVRGGRFSDGSSAGLFSFSADDGGALDRNSFRVVVPL